MCYVFVFVFCLMFGVFWMSVVYVWVVFLIFWFGGVVFDVVVLVIV